MSAATSRFDLAASAGRWTALAAVALASLGPSAARAGTYRAAVCDPGVGAYHADATFERSSHRYASAASCGVGGEGLVVRRRGGHTRPGANAAWVIRAPTATVISGLSAKAAGRSRGGEAPELLVGDGSGLEPFAQPRESVERFRWSGATTRTFAARLRCERRPRCSTARGSRALVKRVTLILRDESTPRLALGGSLFAPGSRRGFDAADVTARDLGSGVRRFLLQVNGAPVSSRTIGCHLRGRIAVRLAPCPRNAAADFVADTATAPFRQGPNRVRVCVADYALTTASNHACARRRLRVDNLCPRSPASATLLRARLRRHGAAASVAGRLVDGAGAGVPGARVCVATRVRISGAPERIAAVAPTDDEGRFRIRLAEGPSRGVRVAWWPRRGPAIERFLHLEVPASPRLRLRPEHPIRNGDQVRFRVRLGGPARGGRRVAVQAASGRRWIDVRRGRAGARGVYRARYRFHATTGRRTYRFRALVPKQDGYPYEAGISKVRRVVVLG